MSSPIQSPPVASPEPQRGAHDTSHSATARPVLRYLANRLFNPLAKRFAGSRATPIFALARTRGRRSGRMYATPVAARPTASGFIIPLTFGVGADWFRNMQAAGWAVVRWKGVERALVEPEVVDWATGGAAFSGLERALMWRFGVRQFARLRDAPRLDTAQDTVQG